MNSYRTQNTVISLLRLCYIHQLIGYNQQAGPPRPSSSVPEMCFPKGVSRGPVYIYISTSPIPEVAKARHSYKEDAHALNDGVQV